MTIDPIVVALAGTIVTIAGVLFRELVKARDKAEASAAFWQDRALKGTGLAAIATEVAEKNGSVKP